MKQILLSLSLVFYFASGALAQSPCAPTITKSGTGLTRTYTSSSTASGTVYYNIYTYGYGSASNSNTLTVTYPGGGVYTVMANAYNGTCYDSTIYLDTVLGPVYCPTNFSMSTYKYQTLPKFNFYLQYLPVTPPGYTRTILYDYGDGTTGTDEDHLYLFPQNNIKVKVSVTYTHPTYASCILKDSTYLDVNACAGVLNEARAFVYGGNYAFSSGSVTSPGNSYNFNTNWYLLDSATGLWDNIGTGCCISYAFAANGNYVVLSSMSWYKTNQPNSFCIATDTLHLNVQNANNNFEVAIYRDTLDSIPSYIPQVKTWLIKKDAVLGSLSAIDSVITSMSDFQRSYTKATFNNVAAGTYRTKSYIINQPSSVATGYLPTYSDSIAYWSNADTFVFNTDTSLFARNRLIKGSPTSGPGFIGGLISAGANKGTAEGDPVKGIEVLLRDMSGKLISVATTSADGRYMFQNLGIGVYIVYPEELNFHTTASDPIVISTTTAGIIPRYNFKRNAADKEYVPGISLGIASAAELKATVTPNPATDKLQINLGSAAGKVTATLSNTTGQVVLQEVITGTNATLSVSQLPAGMYLLQLYNGKEVHTEKVQIQH